MSFVRLYGKDDFTQKFGVEDIIYRSVSLDELFHASLGDRVHALEAYHRIERRQSATIDVSWLLHCDQQSQRYEQV